MNKTLIGVIAAVAILGFMVYMLFIKKYKEAQKLTHNVKTAKAA